MAIEKRKIGSTEFEFDTELGGAVVRVPDELQPKAPKPPADFVELGTPIVPESDDAKSKTKTAKP